MDNQNKNQNNKNNRQGLSFILIVTLVTTPVSYTHLKKGTLSELLAEVSPDERNDFISITLTDEEELYKPREQLDQVYSHILEVRIENTRTRRKLEELDETVKIQSPAEAFGEFYQKMQGTRMSEEEERFMDEIFEQVKGE